MKNLFGLLTTSFVFLLGTACSSASFDIANAGDGDSGSDTDLDTGTSADGVDPDTGVAPDSGGAETVSDSLHSDTFVPETTAPDTLPDTLPDTFVPDTGVDTSPVDTGPKGPCDEISGDSNAVIFTAPGAVSGYLGFAGVAGTGSWADPLYVSPTVSATTIVLNEGPRPSGTKIQFIVGRTSSSSAPLTPGTIYSWYDTSAMKFHSTGTYTACHGKTVVGTYVEPTFTGALKQSDSSPTTEKLMFITP